MRPIATGRELVRVAHPDLVAFAQRLFTTLGVPEQRAAVAAQALCHGDLTGVGSHGLANVTRLYLKLFVDERVDPRAEPEIVADSGAAVRIDAKRGLGLWVAAEAMDLAIERARAHGVGLVSVFGSTHVGCAGYHALHAAQQGMVGLLASNCGRQRVARPPGGVQTLLGTNPLSIAAPAGERAPFVLDMSTTVVPTGRVRAAARAGRTVPAGWLQDELDRPVTDAEAFDRGDAHLLWLGGSPETGAYKGFGLALAVEVLAGALSGSGLGPEPAALEGDGRPSGLDDDIGFLAAAIAPAALRPAGDFEADTESLFGTILGCLPARGGEQISYPGWPEAERAAQQAAHGVELPLALYIELQGVAQEFKLTLADPIESS